MAHTIALGKRPKHFKREITFKLPEGGEASIEMTFVYRTRSEFGVFFDKLMASAGIEAPKGDSKEAERFSLARVMSGGNEKNAEYILQMAEGWNVEGHEFSLPNVLQLCDELPGAANAIMEQYRAAIVEGRLGN